MKILGIDPGYERVGIAIVSKEELLYSACFKTEKTLSLSERITLIGAEIGRLIEEYSPELLAIETLFFNKNVKTAMGVAEARGVIIATSAARGLSVREFSPLQIKQAVTGSGRADKRQMINMVPKLIKMDARKRIDDEYDAIAVALTCSASEKFGQKTL